MKEIYNQETGELTYIEEVVIEAGGKRTIYFPKPFDAPYNVAVIPKEGTAISSLFSTHVVLVNVSDEECHAEVIISNRQIVFFDLMKKE